MGKPYGSKLQVFNIMGLLTFPTKGGGNNNSSVEVCSAACDIAALEYLLA